MNRVGMKKKKSRFKRMLKFKIPSRLPIFTIVGLMIFGILYAGNLFAQNAVLKMKMEEYEKEEKLTPTTTPTATPTETAPTLLEITKKIYKQVTPTPTAIIYTPPPTIYVTATPQSPATYRILSLSELANMNGANSQTISDAYTAYNTFLQTSNLQYKTYEQQRELFTSLITVQIQKSLDQQKALLQQQIDAMSQQTQNYNQIYEEYQECLNNKITVINSNPFLSESTRLSRIEKAKQDCAN